MKMNHRHLIHVAGTLALALSIPVTAHAKTDERKLRKELTQLYDQHNVLSIPVHRGGGTHQPENTIEAFEYAWARHMVPEADVHMSKDGKIVVIHDTTLTRTAPGAPAELRAKKIQDMTVAELKSVDVGAFRGFPGQRIPTLDEVFAVMAKDPAKFLYLDYKNIDLNVLEKLVKHYRVEQQVIFTTEKYELIKDWRKRVPNSQTMIWMGGSEEKINDTLNMLRAADFAGVYIVHMHYRPVPGTNDYNMSDRFMLDVQAELAAKGVVVQIMPWNIEDPLVFERLFKIGIHNIGTDYPDLVQIIRPKFMP